ncbi:hypothetical protein CCP3SC15_20004 [Gammaproteobacteria bacterium]
MARQKAEAARQKAEIARQAAEQRAVIAQAEIDRLKALLEKDGVFSQG